MMAAEKGHHECVSLIVTSGADINAVSKSLEVTCTTCLSVIGYLGFAIGPLPSI